MVTDFQDHAKADNCQSMWIHPPSQVWKRRSWKKQNIREVIFSCFKNFPDFFKKEAVKQVQYKSFSNKQLDVKALILKQSTTKEWI